MVNDGSSPICEAYLPPRLAKGSRRAREGLTKAREGLAKAREALTECPSREHSRSAHAGRRPYGEIRGTRARPNPRCRTYARASPTHAYVLVPQQEWSRALAALEGVAYGYGQR